MPGSLDKRSAGELDSIALQRVASRQAVAPGKLKVISSATASYPSVGKVAHEYKTMDQSSGTIHGVALDDAGQEVDAAELQDSERAAREAVERRLDAPLAARLASARADELIEVAIWLAEPAYRAPARPAAGSDLSRAQSDQLVAQADAQRSSFVKALAEPFAARLRGRGIAAKAEAMAPVVFASLSPAQIEELRGSSEVDRMYLPERAEPTLAAERNSIFAPTVNSRGITGAGVPMADVEVFGGQVNAANPYLAGVTQDFTLSCVSAHTAAVSGIIRSTNSPEMGVAPGANLWVGGTCGNADADLMSQSTAAMNWGTRVINLSLGADLGGALGALDRFYDGVVINQFRTVVPAAGNSGNGAVVLSPGTAYNVVTVGAYDEQTNTMAGFSSGVDPGSTHSDREKPEVAAPGVDFLSTINASPWIGSVGSGTSYAAPMVTGTAALLMQRDPSLQVWPEGIRAILMATATRNLEGATRLSELDGAGGIFADFADDVASGVFGTWSGIGYDCSAAPSMALGTMSLVAGHTARVVISWDTDPSYASYTTQPSADLDLIITDPNGATAAVSASFDNTYEIVEFTAGVTGTYTINVSKFRCDMSPRWLAFAHFSL